MMMLAYQIYFVYVCAKFVWVWYCFQVSDDTIPASLRTEQDEVDGRAEDRHRLDRIRRRFDAAGGHRIRRQLERLHGRSTVCSIRQVLCALRVDLRLLHPARRHDRRLRADGPAAEAKPKTSQRFRPAVRHLRRCSGETDGGRTRQEGKRN